MMDLTSALDDDAPSTQRADAARAELAKAEAEKQALLRQIEVRTCIQTLCFLFSVRIVFVVPSSQCLEVRTLLLVLKQNMHPHAHACDNIRLLGLQRCQLGVATASGTTAPAAAHWHRWYLLAAPPPMLPRSGPHPAPCNAGDAS